MLPQDVITPTSPLTLSIIIVSFNTCEITISCLQSILRALDFEPTLKQSTEILVVDNASTDESVPMIKKFLSESGVKHSVLGNIVNLGFAGANNQGLLIAKGAYILLLNSDTIVGKRALSVMVNTAKQQAEPEFLHAASLWNTDKSYQPQGGDLPGIGSLFCFALMLDDLPLIGRFLPSIQHTGRRARPLKNSVTQFGWVAGTALLFPASVATSVGLLDEAIFMYAEDVDLCWRANQVGIHSYIVRDAKVVHLGSASSSASTALVGEFTSLAYLVRKHCSVRKAAIAISLLRLAARVRKQFYAMMGNQELKDVYLKILTLPALRQTEF